MNAHIGAWENALRAGWSSVDPIRRGTMRVSNQGVVYLAVKRRPQAFKHLSIGWNLALCSQFYGCSIGRAAWDGNRGANAAPATQGPPSIWRPRGLFAGAFHANCGKESRLLEGFKTRGESPPYTASAIEDAFHLSNPRKRPEWSGFGKYVGMVAAAEWAPGRTGGLKPPWWLFTTRRCVLRSSVRCDQRAYASAPRQTQVMAE